MQNLILSHVYKRKYSTSFCYRWLHDLPSDYEKTDLPIYDPEVIGPETPEPETDIPVEKYG